MIFNKFVILEKYEFNAVLSISIFSNKETHCSQVIPLNRVGVLNIRKIPVVLAVLLRGQTWKLVVNQK